jgi:uncharacterized membrane protein
MPHVPSAFGEDAFGRRAEAAARFFGTPKYIAGQTAAVIAWIAVNALAVSFRWDPYPFILLNLAFSTQAAYAAPLILLAQTRQADRDKNALDHLEAHREAIMRHMQEREAAIKKETTALKLLIEANTVLTQEDKELTEKIEALTREIHARRPAASSGGRRRTLACLRAPGLAIASMSGDRRLPRLRRFFGLVAGGVRLRGMDDDDRARCVVDALLADRAEHQPCEPAVSA